jgi:twinkle protein
VALVPGASLGDGVIALERDQQGENPNESFIRVLKNRPIGRTGLADTLVYNPDTGRLLVEDVAEFLGNVTKESENLDF